MKKALFFKLLLIFICSSSLFAEQLPTATGPDVIGYLNEVNYRHWQLWPGKSAFYKGSYPHGALLTTYVSPGAYKAIEAKAGRIPAGEFIVKENYSTEKTLAAVTVMYKQVGYNAEGGDRFWLKYAADGSIQAEGKVGGCIGCHAAVQSNDWLFIGPLR